MFDVETYRVESELQAPDRPQAHEAHGQRSNIQKHKHALENKKQDFETQDVMWRIDDTNPRTPCLTILPQVLNWRIEDGDPCFDSNGDQIGHYQTLNGSCNDFNDPSSGNPRHIIYDGTD